ncbi:MAG: hypothetical protein KGH98_04445 [Candidatus Micrarchaeota archaeon]|nr:hypothetical protein [Candidatus Micrarchaeota archaeon]MDE1857295.1 hypothetical protein [Candidatus Micrarchaeota archaeon]
MERGRGFYRETSRDDSETAAQIKSVLREAAVGFLITAKGRFDSLGVNVGMDNLVKATSAIYNALSDRYLMKRDDNISGFTVGLPPKDRMRLAEIAMNDFSVFIKEADGAIAIKFLNMCISGHEDGNAKDFLNELVSNDPRGWLKESKGANMLRLDAIGGRHEIVQLERISSAGRSPTL